MVERARQDLWHASQRQDLRVDPMDAGESLLGYMQQDVKELCFDVSLLPCGLHGRGVEGGRWTRRLSSCLFRLV